MHLLLVPVLSVLMLAVSPGSSLAEKRESDLAKCQQTIEKESAKQKQKEQASYAKCLQAVRNDTLKKGMAEPTDKTAQKCKKELRKINDTRPEAKTHAKKSKAKMMSACDPATKEFSDADVLENMPGGKKGLHGKNLEAHCQAEGEVASMSTAADLVDCVVKSTTKSAHKGVKEHSPKASEHLKDVSDKIKALPVSPEDPSANDDAAGAADDALETIDPDEDGVPNTSQPFNAAARVIFVSSQTFNGNFSGAINGNEECDTMAFDAGLPGDFMIWISDGVVLAADELFSLTSNPNIPYVTMNGTVVANDVFDFVNGSLVSPINVDETGASVPDEPVWTSSDSVGDNIIDNCVGYNSSSPGDTGHVGRTSLADSGWTDFGPQACDQPARIYCIEVDNQP